MNGPIDGWMISTATYLLFDILTLKCNVEFMELFKGIDIFAQHYQRNRKLNLHPAQRLLSVDCYSSIPSYLT